jgi:hypothetical protein
VGYALRPACDLPGPIDVSSGATVRVISLVWRDDRCAGPSAGVERVVEVPLVGPGPLLVRDDTAGGTARLMLTVAPDRGGPCSRAVLDAPCQRDCDCQMADSRARCLPADGASAVLSCGLPCATDADCSQSFAGAVCSAEAGYRCATTPCHVACAPGQTLAGCVCVPPPSVGRSCQCDGDCQPGQLCSGGRCQATCVASDDCGPGYACSGLCSSQ